LLAGSTKMTGVAVASSCYCSSMDTRPVLMSTFRLSSLCKESLACLMSSKGGISEGWT